MSSSSSLPSPSLSSPSQDELERTLANGSDGMREIESKVKRLETAKKQVDTHDVMEPD